MEVYLDHAATTPLRGEVLEAMLPCLKENFGNPDSPHAAGRRAASAVTRARDEIAALLGVRPSEVFFTSGGTEADNWAVRGMGEGSVLVSPVEHAAVLSAAPLRQGGYSLCVAGRDGIVRAEEVASAMREDTGLVAVMAVNNETGCVQPIEEIAEKVHARGALLFSDCVQAACTLDLRELLRSADAISLSAHKMGGPKGVGLLCVKRGAPLRPLLAGGEQERSLRGGTLNVAGIVGLAAALALAVKEREDFCRHTAACRDLFEALVLGELGGLAVRDGEERAPNISHLTFRNGGDAAVNLLDLNGVLASGGAACSAHAALPSHVMLAMGRTEEEARRGIRFSFGRETTEEEVRFAAEQVVRCMRSLP